MGRSGGGGGGGRSGGFSGGGRSSGSFSGGFGSGRSGRSSGSRPSGGRSPGGPVFHSPRTVFVHSPRYYGAPPPGGPPPRRRRSGCGVTLAAFVIVVVFVTVIFALLSFGGDSGVAKSTVAREPLPSGAVTETDYYTDEPGWISNKSALTSGMKAFYKQTGVQPYLYIAQTVDGTAYPSSQAMESRAQTLYDDLFTDEAHFLLVFCDNGNDGYTCGYSVGAQAKTVMDDEAVGILADYLDRYYFSDNMSDEEFFSTTFEKTADRIMSVTRSPWPTVLIVVVVAAAVIVVIVLLYKWWKRAKEQKNREAKQTQDILNTPLEKFGDLEAEELAKKYEETPKEP